VHKPFPAIYTIFTWSLQKCKRGVLLYTYKKWFLPGKAMLNMQINVQCIEDILSEQQTNQEPDEEEDKHEEAITQKPICIKATEYLNALLCFVRFIAEVPQQIWKTLLQQTEKNYKQSTPDNFFKKL
jgi:hypothetical protein